MIIKFSLLINNHSCVRNYLGPARINSAINFGNYRQSIIWQPDISKILFCRLVWNLVNSYKSSHESAFELCCSTTFT